MNRELSEHSLEDARKSAQRRANLEQRPFVIWEHTQFHAMEGTDGQPHGYDVLTYRVQPESFPPQPETWLVKETVQPEERIETP